MKMSWNYIENIISVPGSTAIQVLDCNKPNYEQHSDLWGCKSVFEIVYLFADYVESRIDRVLDEWKVSGCFGKRFDQRL